jgi:NADH:ubiquinone oxidoreductase subunit 5 (subunit L)/multisubunit Na+/H+ antiporter MnhA subunit
MKLIHATFLGQAAKESSGQVAKEVSWTMWLPALILAVICVVFGVFANQIPLKYFILPAVTGVGFMGTWFAGLATLLIFIGLVLGILIFKIKSLKPKLRQDSAFFGAEPVELQEERVSGTEFYNTVKEFGFLKGIYRKAEAGCFDIYEQGKNFVFGIGKIFQYLHNGILPTYLVWCLLGMLVLFIALLFR